MSKSESKKSLKKKGEGYDYFWYDFAKVTGTVPLMIWIRPKIYYPEGKPRLKGGFMISSNHSSFIDPFAVLAVFWYRRVFSLATKDLYDTPRKRWMFESMRCIKVDKENFSLDSFHEVIRRLKNKKVICIFPEGQINFDSDDVLAFKSGVILMAHTAGAPIVPIYLAPVGKWYQRRVIVVGKPINIREICGFMPTIDQLNGAADLVHAKEQELKEFYFSKYNKKETVKQEASTEQEEVILNEH